MTAIRTSGARSKPEYARIAGSVSDVTAIANDTVGRPAARDSVPSDSEIAHAIISGLKEWLPESWDRIRPTVQSGHVVLKGTVAWHHERDRAEGVARSVKGVASVGNSVRVVPIVAADAIKHKIEEAFRRSAEIDAERIAVNASGTEVTLRGRVRTWAEREEAQRSAWSVSGVTKVTNNLRVRP